MLQGCYKNVKSEEVESFFVLQWKKISERYKNEWKKTLLSSFREAYLIPNTLMTPAFSGLLLDSLLWQGSYPRKGGVHMSAQDSCWQQKGAYGKILHSPKLTHKNTLSTWRRGHNKNRKTDRLRYSYYRPFVPPKPCSLNYAERTGRTALIFLLKTLLKICW